VPSPTDGARPRRLPKLRDSVLLTLQERILAGDWPVGGRIPTENELCDELGVSRTLVRDVVRTLVSRGLLDVVHGHGMIVAEPREEAAATALVLLLGRSDVTVGDVLDARGPLEAGIAFQAAIAGNAQDWAAMRELLTELGQAVKDNEQTQAERLHREWHQSLVGACHMPALEVLVRPLQAITAITSLPPRLDGTDFWDVDAHEAILRAAEAGDSVGAQEAMHRHFERTMTREYRAMRKTRFHAMRTLESFERVLGSGPVVGDSAARRGSKHGA
jgi:GntR family transcriptional regulator, transcriptional repressor for pyruvate dehydrogenase complex